MNGALLSLSNFTNANLSGGTSLSSANLSLSTLVNANLTMATLYGANLANANARGINLSNANLYMANGANVNLSDAVLAGANLSQANLSSANLSNSNLSGVNLAVANLSSSNLSNANLSNSNLSFSNLSNGNFSGALLSGAKLTNAVSDGFTYAQLASTLSFLQKDLANVWLDHSDLSNWDLSGQNLVNTVWYEDTFTNTNFSDADLRGGVSWSPQPTTIVRNTISASGIISGLSLSAGEILVIRNFPLGITVKTSANFSPTSILDFVIDENGWGSTISFAAGVIPALNGILELDIDPSTNPATMVGQSYDLFNWGTGLPASDRFASTLADAPTGYEWNTAQLYTTGDVSLMSVPEPGTWAFLSMGAMGCVAWPSRRVRRGCSTL
jgi:uncharacterized protein YjbI with pentapeptide repeats